MISRRTRRTDDGRDRSGGPGGSPGNLAGGRAMVRARLAAALSRRATACLGELPPLPAASRAAPPAVREPLPALPDAPAPGAGSAATELRVVSPAGPGIARAVQREVPALEAAREVIRDRA